MKRGNTALKRGVGLASAFALAIAGAVIAAPAANAAPTTWGADNVRATPVADAAWVGSTGALTDTGAVGAQYGTSHKTSVAKVVTGSNQLTNGIQIVLQSGQGTAAWAADKTVTVTLDNATFNTSPSISISALVKLNGENSLQYLAGTSVGTHASPAAVVDGSDAAKLAQSTGATLNGAKDTLTITLKVDPAKATAAADQGYVISLTGIKVNVDPSADQGAEISATVAGTAGITGATTIAYVGKLGFSAATGSVDASDTTKPIALPDVTLSEDLVDAFVDGDVDLSLEAQDADGDTVGTLKFSGTPTATASGSDDIDATATGFGATSAGAVTLAGTDGTAKEKVVLSGLKIDGTTLGAAAANVVLTVDNTSGSADNGTGAFSYVPNLDGLSVSVPVARPEQRISGANRYETAAAIAKKLVTGSDAEAFVLANGTDAKGGADALAANFLDLPILLTDSSNSLPKATSDAIKAITKNTGNHTVTIYVLGKTDSVSQAARNEAAVAANSASTARSVTVTEIAGSNRYATSAAVAGKGSINSFALQDGEPYLKTAFLASGTTNADALAAGAASAYLGIPVLLTSGAGLDDAVAKAIDDLGIQQLIVLGGTDRVSQAAIDAAKAKGVTSVYRIAGSDRYATAAAIYTFLGADSSKGEGLNEEFDSKAYLASGGAGWPDALAVGPLAASGSDLAPVLTTGADTLAPAASKFLKDNKSDITDIWAVGGKDRVSSDVLKAAQALSK